MIGAHIIHTSTEGWQIVREVRDTRASAKKRVGGLGAPVVLVDSFGDWGQAVAESSFPMARVFDGSDNFPVGEKVAAGADPKTEAIAHVNQYLRGHILANHLTRVLVLNEPRTYTDAEMRWLCEFLYAAAEYLYTGFPWRVWAVLGNFAAGSPDGESPQWTQAHALVAACQKFNARIGLHGYFHRPPIVQLGSGEWVVDPVLMRADPFAYRHDVLKRRFLSMGWGRAQFAITEAGFERHDNVPGSARWQETPISGEAYGHGMVLFAASVEWPVTTFTSGDDSGWPKHGVDNHGYTGAVIHSARTAAWLEETPMTTPAPQPTTPRNAAAVFGYYNAGRLIEIRYSSGGTIAQTLAGRTHWIDVFEVRDGFWRVTNFQGARPDWWVREFALQPQ